MSESENQSSLHRSDQSSGSAFGLLILASVFALVGFGMGVLKGFLAEEGGGWALAIDLGWKSALQLCLVVVVVLPLVSLLKHFRSPPVILTVVLMAVGFALMGVGGAIIDGEWQQIGRNLLLGAGQGAIVGYGMGTVHRLGWVKLPFI